MRYSTSLFAQILEMVPRVEFDRIITKHNGERYAKTFDCWTQFVSMLFCQLGQANSLREICGGLASCLGKLSHLGLKEAPKKSTLAHANEHRSWEMFQDLFFAMLNQTQLEFKGSRRKFRFKNKLYSLDASVIDLCATVFNWAKFRRTKGAVKLHLLLDHDGYLPCFACITDGKTHEINMARELRLAPGSIVVMDRGYVDLALFHLWMKQEIFFVTRLKSNMDYEIIESHDFASGTAVRGDYLIRLTSVKAAKIGLPYLRLVRVWDEESQRTFEFITNHFKLAASTIGQIYKDRWQIEIFFKLLKQNLKVKTFVGTSANALKIQIWTALIAILILKILQFRSQWDWSLSNLVALLRFNLFTYRKLRDWINKPFDTPIEPFNDLQLSLF